MKARDLVEDIKSRRSLEWLRHANATDQKGVAGSSFERRPECRRKVGRPKEDNAARCRESLHGVITYKIALRYKLPS
jgi:hypothetical protein